MFQNQRNCRIVNFRYSSKIHCSFRPFPTIRAININNRHQIFSSRLSEYQLPNYQKNRSHQKVRSSCNTAATHRDNKMWGFFSENLNHSALFENKIFDKMKLQISFKKVKNFITFNDKVRVIVYWLSARTNSYFRFL